MTSGVVTATGSSLTRLHVGTSGWSYPSWKPGFYPAELKPPEFLPYYAQRFTTVELNTTGYRLPAEEQFLRWAESTPEGFKFAPKLQAYRLDRIAMAVERVSALGDRLGPIRLTVQAPRDDGMLAFVAGSVDPALTLAWDFRHPSWVDAQLPAGSLRVNELEAEAPVRYLRFRDPPYDDAELEDWAGRIRPLLQGADVYCYFRHEDEPTGPRYAERLLELFR
jgi:uncharacterized protein YecE (DUF72 family)